MGLFQNGDFTSHSGLVLKWKISCDDLTDVDWDCLAARVAEQFDFCRVVPVPEGGVKFARALEKYANPDSSRVLVVDDVMTTGKSMEEVRNTLPQGTPITGVVVFCRGGNCPWWVSPIFRLGWPFREALNTIV